MAYHSAGAVDAMWVGQVASAEGGVAGVVERAQHAGHVAQRGAFLSTQG